MTASEILRIIIKAFGLYFIVLALIGLRDFAMYGIVALQSENQASTEMTYRYMLIGYGFNIVFNCAASFVLLTRSDLIATILSKKQPEKLSIELTKSDSVELIVISISVLVIINAIPEVVSKLTNYVYFNPNEPAYKNEFWSQRNNTEVVLFSVFKVVTGIMTLTNAHRLAVKIAKIGEKDQQGNLES